MGTGTSSSPTRNNRIQKFTNTGTFLTKWGSAGSGDGQFDQSRRRRRGWERERLRRRLRQQPHPGVRRTPVPSSPREAARAAGRGSSISRTASPSDAPAEMCSSPTSSTTASRSSRVHSDRHWATSPSASSSSPLPGPLRVRGVGLQQCEVPATSRGERRHSRPPRRRRGWLAARGRPQSPPRCEYANGPATSTWRVPSGSVVMPRALVS